MWDYELSVSSKTRFIIIFCFFSRRSQNIVYLISLLFSTRCVIFSNLHNGFVIASFRSRVPGVDEDIFAKYWGCTSTRKHSSAAVAYALCLFATHISYQLFLSVKYMVPWFIVKRYSKHHLSLIYIDKQDVLTWNKYPIYCFQLSETL